MIPKYDHETIVTLQHLVVDKVIAFSIGHRAGMIAIKLKDGVIIHLHCRLLSEAKEKVKMFSSKYWVSKKDATALGMLNVH